MSSKNIWYEELKKSEQILDGPKYSLIEIDTQLEKFKKIMLLEVEKISIEQLPDWRFDGETGNLVHSRKKFFSLEAVKSFDIIQPIINQPEIGILGILAKNFDGILHFLFQAKIEPGNVGGIQLSPTVQATRSNYTQAHGGKIPEYLEYFMGDRVVQVLNDQFQSEQGYRYFRKRNRNTVIWTNEDIIEKPGFIWLTLGQVKELLKQDYLMNSCTRSVLACLPYDDSEKGPSLLSDFEVLSKMRSWKEVELTDSKLVPLKEAQGWGLRNGVFCNMQQDDYSIIGVQVTAVNREVSSWSQPLICEARLGEYGGVITYFNGVPHWLLRFSKEPGHRDGIEWGPVWVKRNSVEAGDSNYWEKLASLKPESRVVLDSWFSEEGGRFFNAKFRHRVLYIPNVSEDETPSDCIWLSVSQVFRFLRHANYFTIEARSLWSCRRDTWFET